MSGVSSRLFRTAPRLAAVRRVRPRMATCLLTDAPAQGNDDSFEKNATTPPLHEGKRERGEGIVFPENCRQSETSKLLPRAPWTAAIRKPWSSVCK
eukprot:1500852-Pyramimonas_sp.AAC.1